MKHCINILLLLLSFNCISQQRCHTTEYVEILKNKYPEYKQERQMVNQQTRNWIKSRYNSESQSIITIPVVVHVVWNTSSENISDQQIFSQIDVLNADFRRTNIDAIMTPSVWQSIATDTEIEFCLASVDPNGAFTNGITRTQTSQTSFTIQADAMKSTSTGGIDPWDQDNYLNIWVCDLSGGILGYATPPSTFNNPDDGVVIGYNYFGTQGTVQAPYNKGRTCTHEVGHWLNLDHVWGDANCGNDNVNDTPIQEEENYNCPAFPHNANSCGTSNNNGDMFMNYMDYTNDGCMNLFTIGQKVRMTAAINQYRPALINNNLCNTTPPPPSWNCINGNCVDPLNGNGIYSDLNTCQAYCFCSAGTPPLSEDFQSGIPGWTIINNDGNDTWELTNTAGYNSSSSIYINNAEYSANGEYDDFILPTLDLTSYSSIYLTFDYAYSLWTNPASAQNWSDTLIIYVSDDCGNTWQNVWEKAGLNLTTTTPPYNGFSWTPSSNNDWVSEVIDLSNYTNQDDFAIKFRNVNQYENNLFIDNINLWNNNTEINEGLNQEKKIIRIIDILGRNKSRLSPAVYLYIYDDNSVEKKIIIE